MNRHKLLELLREDYRKSDLGALRRHMSMGKWLLTGEDIEKVSKAIITLQSTERMKLIEHTTTVLKGTLV